MVKTNRLMQILLFVLLPLLGVGQDIPKGADKIELSTMYSDSALFESMLTFLDQEDFVVDKSDAQRGSIITDYQRKGKGFVHIRLLVNIKDKKILIKGQGMVQAAGHKVENEPLMYGGNSLQKKGFVYMDEIIRSLNRRLPQSTLRYLVAN